MNPATTKNDWSSVWDQTIDLTVPTDGKNCYTIAAGAWSKGSGSWSTLGSTGDVTPAATDYYLIGYINGANYGCEEDGDNMASISSRTAS
jgi:hypothetical protein